MSEQYKRVCNWPSSYKRLLIESWMHYLTHKKGRLENHGNIRSPRSPNIEPTAVCTARIRKGVPQEVQKS